MTSTAINCRKNPFSPNILKHSENHTLTTILITFKNVKKGKVKFFEKKTHYISMS